ncbi:unnamed protein product [Mycena citricolor]|uniref:Uncharacterized protein n=1 Tax=Mycena citricolor TaxID=2018698 RepID=A0AAD2HMF1_9AGAR|nr:unnamed protein product [Mycena citricolor]
MQAGLARVHSLATVESVSGSASPPTAQDDTTPAPEAAATTTMTTSGAGADAKKRKAEDENDEAPARKRERVYTAACYICHGGYKDRKTRNKHVGNARCIQRAIAARLIDRPVAQHELARMREWYWANPFRELYGSRCSIVPEFRVQAALKDAGAVAGGAAGPAGTHSVSVSVSVVDLDGDRTTGSPSSSDASPVASAGSPRTPPPRHGADYLWNVYVPSGEEGKTERGSFRLTEDHHRALSVPAPLRTPDRAQALPLPAAGIPRQTTSAVHERPTARSVARSSAAQAASGPLELTSTTRLVRSDFEDALWSWEMTRSSQFDNDCALQPVSDPLQAFLDSLTCTIPDAPSTNDLPTNDSLSFPWKTEDSVDYPAPDYSDWDPLTWMSQSNAAGL